MVRHYYIAEPYPDELIGSVLLRTALHRGLGNKRFSYFFNGFRQSQFPLLISSTLKAISETTSKSSYDLLRDHTPFMFSTAFISKSETLLIADSIIRGESKHFARLIDGATLGNLRPRFCRECINEDLKKFGECYWHLEHNLPFSWRCRAHNQSLREYIGTRSGFTSRELPNKCDGVESKQYLPESLTTLLEDLSMQMLRSGIRQTSKEWYSSYAKFALARGFPRFASGLCGKSISKAFIEFYGAEFLKKFRSYFEVSAKAWPSKMLHPYENGRFTTRRHIMIIAFLIGAETPKKLSDVQSERRIKDRELLDRTIYRLLQREMTEDAASSRHTASELLHRIGLYGSYANHRAELPLTRQLVSEWYNSNRLRRAKK